LRRSQHGHVVQGHVPGLQALGVSPEEYERRYLLQALTQTSWIIKGPQGAAARLRMSPSTLHGRMKKLGIARPEGR
jgi:transcriptional regulator with GAF, ATPase, and Fis domain